MTSTHKRREWIEGPALETAIALKAIQPGDEIFCSYCNEKHFFVKWVNEKPMVQARIGDGDATVMAVDCVVKWRPKPLTPTHKEAS